MCPNKPYQYTSDDYLKSRWKYWWSIQQAHRWAREPRAYRKSPWIRRLNKGE